MKRKIIYITSVMALCGAVTVSGFFPFTSNAEEIPSVSDNTLVETVEQIPETEEEPETETEEETETESESETETETETEPEEMPESAPQPDPPPESTQEPESDPEPESTPQPQQPQTTKPEEATEITVNCIDDELYSLLYNYLIKTTVLVDRLNAEADTEPVPALYEEENAELLNQYLTLALSEPETETEEEPETETETEEETETETEEVTALASLSDNDLHPDIYESVKSIHEELKETKAITSGLLFSILAGIGIFTGITIFRRFR